MLAASNISFIITFAFRFLLSKYTDRGRTNEREWERTGWTWRGCINKHIKMGLLLPMLYKTYNILWRTAAGLWTNQVKHSHWIENLLNLIVLWVQLFQFIQRPFVYLYVLVHVAQLIFSVPATVERQNKTIIFILSLLFVRIHLHMWWTLLGLFTRCQ